MNLRFALALAASALLAGCSSVEQNVAPEPSPSAGGASHDHVDEAAPIAGGALFNGN